LIAEDVGYRPAVADRTTDRRDPDGPGLERTVTLTDAVVAIAMTLLVLPLVEVSGDVDANHLREFSSEHGNLLLSFVISFLVIYRFWAAHGSAFARLYAAQEEGETQFGGPPGLSQLNMWWLLVIAFLPFPTALVGRELTTSSAPLYVGTMAVLSLLTTAIAIVVDRAVPGPKHRASALVTTLVFVVCTIVSTVNASAGVFGLLALVVLGLVEARRGRGASVAQ
jgi:uncharacterized membrane protein